MSDYNKPTSGFDSTLVLVSYVISLFTAVVEHFIWWAIKKDDEQTTTIALIDVANFVLSYTIYMFIAWATTIILIGYILGPIVTIAFYVFAIIGIVKAVNGEAYKPPFTIDIFK